MRRRMLKDVRSATKILSRNFIHMQKKQKIGASKIYWSTRQRLRHQTKTEQWKTIHPTLDIYAARAHIFFAPFVSILFYPCIRRGRLMPSIGREIREPHPLEANAIYDFTILFVAHMRRRRRRTSDCREKWKKISEVQMETGIGMDVHVLAGGLALSWCVNEQNGLYVHNVHLSLRLVSRRRRPHRCIFGRE